jgi:hypothetical protein
LKSYFAFGFEFLKEQVLNAQKKHDHVPLGGSCPLILKHVPRKNFSPLFGGRTTSLQYLLFLNQTNEFERSINKYHGELIIIVNVKP